MNAMNQAYRNARLHQIGYTLERALDTPCLAIALRVQVRHRVTRCEDTMHCSCGRQWDVRDDQPPATCTR